MKIYNSHLIRLWRIVLSPDVDALCRTYGSAEFTANAFLGAVEVSVQHVTAMEALRFHALLIWVLCRDRRSGELPQRHGEPSERSKHVGEPTHRAFPTPMVHRSF